jgi:murein DD-endopeptidase MepM/ murein hydrolase activator NlpD
MTRTRLFLLLSAAWLLAACSPIPGTETLAPELVPAATETATPFPEPTPFPTRPRYAPGQLVEYFAQTGDTLETLAVRFNTSVTEIREANPIIPLDATTMPPGLPMQIPIYYLPLWGSPYQILPDWRFVNGPSAVEFYTADFVLQQPGWLKSQVAFVAGQNRIGGEIVDHVAMNFSVDPRLLLALLEFQARALSDPVAPANVDSDLLGYRGTSNQGLYLQLVWAANQLNDGYYRSRHGNLLAFDLLNGELERPDPWQNAATVSIQHFFSKLFEPDAYRFAIGPDGLAGVYRSYFGDPWEVNAPHLPGSLTQPELTLPFERNTAWTYTGGPHTGWGSGAPFAALDFAPPSMTQGCFASDDWATAPAEGVIVRSQLGVAVLDLDMDGDERTGWNIFFLHIATDDRVRVGDHLQRGDRVGHPSCEGGTSTGTHIHIARKYNGEWIHAGSGAIPFNLEGWVARDGPAAYLGELVRGNQIIRACECSNMESRIVSGQ